MKIDDNTFFDIHMHSFNLSHPYFYSFIRRFKLLPEALLQAGIKWVILVAAILGIIFGIIFGLIFWAGGLHLIVSVIISIAIFILLFAVAVNLPVLRKKITALFNKGRTTLFNMLAIFENDLGSFFLIIEDCFREKKDLERGEKPLIEDGEIKIGDKYKYHKIVITPLMMDFGYKGKKEGSEIHYNQPAEKPIAEQVTDVFNGIRKYKESPLGPKTPERIEDFRKKYPNLDTQTERIIEIYPFLGLNTSIYDLEYIKKLLKKYFETPDKKGNVYNGHREDLFINFGQFEGKIDDIPSNFFAGIKVYPPLGFHPWPVKQEELDKVKYLYEFCVNHNIPITSHGGSSGFVAIEDYTSISRWETVLDEANFPKLKLNIAHFPAESKYKNKLPIKRNKIEIQRLNSIIKLILSKPNVYTDFSCRATSEEYYTFLRKIIDSYKGSERETLTSHILFGSDFPVNLGAINSYNKYIRLFRNTLSLTPEEKHAFCCVNPQHFLFTE